MRNDPGSAPIPVADPGIMPRFVLHVPVLTAILMACGPQDAAEAPADAPEKTTPASEVDRTCIPFGNGCAAGKTYDMCCAGSDCVFEFNDGLSFSDIDNALVYCTTGVAVSDPAHTAAPNTNLGGGAGPNGGDRTPPTQPDPNPSGGSDPTAPGAGNGSSGSGNSQGGQCYGSVTACVARNGPSACHADPGCYYTYEMCEGSAWSCQSFGSPSGCSGQLGCYWSYHYEQCLGAAVSCGSRSSRGSCHVQYGCRWREGTCSGAVRNCSGYYSESSCRGPHGCYWR